MSSSQREKISLKEIEEIYSHLFSTDSIENFRGYRLKTARTVFIRVYQVPIQAPCTIVFQFLRKKTENETGSILNRLIKLPISVKWLSESWVQFEIHVKKESQTSSVLRKACFFIPKGLFGFLFGYFTFTFSRWRFSKLCRQVRKQSEKVYRGMKAIQGKQEVVKNPIVLTNNLKTISLESRPDSPQNPECKSIESHLGESEAFQTSQHLLAQTPHAKDALQPPLAPA